MAGRKGEEHWLDAVMVGVHRIREGGPRPPQILAQLAERCVSLALEGDMQAIKEIGNRLDGRAPQSMEVTADDISSMSREELEEEIASIESSIFGRPRRLT